MRATDSKIRLETLADTLWQERHMVEFLLFKLVTAKLLLSADERRFTTMAVDEVDRVLEALREAEQRRAAAVDAVAAQFQMPAEQLTLSTLATRCREPLRTVFSELADSFQTLAAEVEETAALNRRLASTTLDHVQQALDALTGPATTTVTYTAAGRHDAPPTTAPLRLDQVL